MTVSLTLGGINLCFVNCHLAAHHQYFTSRVEVSVVTWSAVCAGSDTLFLFSPPQYSDVWSRVRVVVVVVEEPPPHHSIAA